MRVLMGSEVRCLQESAPWLGVARLEGLKGLLQQSRLFESNQEAPKE